MTADMGTAKRTFLKGCLRRMFTENVLRRLHKWGIMVKPQLGGAKLLHRMKELQSAIKAELKVLELMNNSQGEAAVKAAPALQARVTVKEVSDPVDMLKELNLFMQKAARKQPKEQPAAAGPAASTSAPQPNNVPAASMPQWRHRPLVHNSCKEMGHMRNQCEEFEADRAAGKGLSWGRSFFWLDRSPVEGQVPQDVGSGSLPLREKRRKARPRWAKGMVWKLLAMASNMECVQTGEVFLGEPLEKTGLDPVPVLKAKPEVARQPVTAPTAGGNRKKAAE
ncbi:hypothetical protein PTTG_29363, partial [Puccinia triticina 1-1 BBBD Race 1]